MGENVQKDLELMTPEILELKGTKLFKNSEISNLIKKRRNFDWNINGITKRLQDFKEPIDYEKALLLELMHRRSARNLPLKRQNIDFCIIKRIQSFYSTAMVNFPDDFELHLEYFNFLKPYQTFHTTVTEHIKKMIQKFESNPRVFKVAASWFNKTVNQKEAITILLRGLSRHPFDQEMYLKLIDLELQEPDEHRLQQRLKEYVNDIMKNIHNHTFLLKILEILGDYPNLMELQNYIISELFRNYSTEEDVWNHIALRELNGLYYEASPEEENNKTTRKSIKRCISRYKKGIATLPLKKQPLLWKLYLNTVIDLMKKDQDVAVTLKADSLKQALEDAKRAHIKLDETHWAAWIDACGSNTQLLEEKLEEGTKELRNSCMLWALYLKHYILKDKSVQAEQIFERAVTALGPKATFIWDMYIDYHLIKSPLSEVNALYQKAVNEPYQEVSKIFKPRYLTWTVLSYGLEEGRKVYWEMADRPPYCKELHEEMVQLELMEYYHMDMGNRLKVIALYAKQFGQQDVDVWIQWISFIREQKSLDQNEKEREIYEQAVKSLPERMINDFKEKYNALEK